MNTNLFNLKKSFLKMLSTYLENKSELIKYNTLIHMPSVRLSATFSLYFLTRPRFFYLILSEEVQKTFEQNYNDFLNFYNNEIFPEFTEDIKKELKDFPAKMEDIKIIRLTENQFSDIQNFKDHINHQILSLLKRLNPENILIDITGGTKLHSLTLANLASSHNLSYCYLMVNENKSTDGISALAGTERLYIQSPEYKKISYLSIHAFPILSILNDQISCFYAGKTIFSRLKIDKNSFEKIKSLFNKYSQNYSIYLNHDLIAMLEQDFVEIKNKIRSFFEPDFLRQLEIYMNESKIFAISLSNKLWNFPFEFIFNDFNDFILLRAVPEINESAKMNETSKENEKSTLEEMNQIQDEKSKNKKENEKIKENKENKGNKNEKLYERSKENERKEEVETNKDKIKILVASFSKEEYMKNQYEELLSSISSNNSIYANGLFLPTKEEFLYSLQNCDIAHIICHGVVRNGIHGLIMEKSTMENSIAYEGKDYIIKDYIIIERKDFENIKAPKFLFISACSSLTIDIEWDKTIYYELIKNGCKTIVGTHWAVPQRQAALVSKYFYKCFFSGQPVGMALHSALQEINDQFLSRNYYFIGNHTARIS